MTDPHWQRIKDLFTRASGLPPASRKELLDGECGADVELRREVESLLAAHKPTGNGAASEYTLVEGPGTRVGPYRILEEIGEGGFGTVFLAEQEVPVRRRVALKVIKAGMDTRQVVARFEQERQALALMDHPGIARVLDGGTTGSGRPYFVMELVRGDPITAYCDREKLSTRERLEVFAQVCRAVQHAHNKGVIHRDLKPGNVLVTIVDGKPVPKVIDFGVAKATQGRLTDKTLFTEHRQMIGTPLYMSPEQAHLSGVDVDTRSDVYSLGVLLYELLTGVPPFEQSDLLKAGIAEMHRMIRELEPRKPSTRVATLGPASTLVAAQRRVEPGKLGLLLRGDLDWIAMRCLEKERARRYETASDLARDVERHLAGEAVEAAPPSATYRMRKLLWRNRGKTLAAGVVASALGLGLVGTSVGLQRARLAEERTGAANVELKASIEDAEWSAYSAGLLLAQRAIQQGDYPGARQSLAACLETRRGWEWEYLSRVAASVEIQYDESTVILNPDGRVVWTPSQPGTSQFRDLKGTPIGVAMEHGAEVLGGKFSPDGQSFLACTADRSLQLWSLAGERVGAAMPHEGFFWATFGFSPAGRLVVTASATHVTRLWNLSGEPVGVSMEHGGKVISVSFSPDGQLVLTASDDSSARLWNLSGEPVGVSMEHGGKVTSASFSPDGQLVLTASDDNAARLWNLSGGTIGVPMGHPGQVISAKFSPDGRLVLTGATDGGARLWNLGGEQVGEPIWHKSRVGASFTKDGKYVVTGIEQGGGTVMRLWDLGGRAISGRIICGGLEGGLHDFHPNGEHVLTSLGYAEPMQLWSLSEREDPELSFGSEPIGRLAVDQVLASSPRPRGQGVHDRASLSADGHVLIPDRGQQAPPGSLALQDQVVRSMAVLPDGSRVVTVGHDGSVRFWETRNWHEVASLPVDGEIESLEVTGDGNRLVLRLRDGSARIWDVRRPEERRAEVQREFSERRPAGEVVDALLNSTLPATDLFRAIEEDPSLSPLRRRVAAEVLEERLHGLEWEADAAIRSISAGVTKVEDLRSAIDGAPVARRIKELMVAKTGAWEPDGWALNSFAWTHVKRPVADASTELAPAVAAARMAVELDPSVGDWLTTLGVALFRSGEYQEALDMLLRAKPLNIRRGAASVFDLAFIAMSLHKIGDESGARAELDELRRRVAQESDTDPDERAAFAEAVALIGPVAADADLGADEER